MVKVFTDSVSDLPNDVANEMGITIVPLYVHFGSEAYKDGVDLSAEEFYHKLEASSTLPTTSAPSPGLFAEFFDKLAEETDEIIGVLVAKKLSATYTAALQGIELMNRKCRVELVDSTLAIMGEGLLVIEAAKRARDGATLKELVDMISRTVSRTHVRVTLDTLRYLAMGGRIGKAQALLGSMLKMNPIIGVKNGDVLPFAKVRSREKANEWLYKFTANFSKVEALAIEYGTSLGEAKALADRIASIWPNVPIYMSRVSPVVGTHTGPGVLSVSVLEG
jgi:DegV family protein with EDD domain